MSCAVCLALLLALALGGIARMSDERVEAATTIQLVRLNVSAESGMVRIEITADGALADLPIEQMTRGRETIVRVRGALSLLKQNYAIDEQTAQGVRTAVGRQGSEPYVDVIITRGPDATIAQKVVFNRLVIGIATDFAGLRKRTADSQTQIARSRNAAQTGGAANAPSANAKTANSKIAPKSTDASVNEVAVASQLQSNQNAATNVTAEAIFRGHTIWNGLNVEPRSFAGVRDASQVALMFASPETEQTQTSTPGLFPVEANWSVPMTLREPGMSVGVWVPGTSTSASDDVGGRRVGNGLFRPSVLFGAALDDRFFYRSPFERNVGIFTLAPRLEYEIPGPDRALRLTYEPRLRRLSNGNWANGHFVDFDTRMGLARWFRVSLRDHFARSQLNPREYDPAGETYIVGDTYTRNDAGLRAEFSIDNRNRIALDGGYNLVKWSDDHIRSAPLFVNYDEKTGALTYEHDVSDQTTVFGTFTFGDTRGSVPLRPQFTGLHNFRRYVYEIGARVQESETSGLNFRVGYEHDQFRFAPRANRFNSLVFDVLYRRDLTQNVNFQLAGLRKTQVSIFNIEGGNARLVTTGGSGRLEGRVSEKLSLGYTARYQQLLFPVAVIPETTASGGVAVGAFTGRLRKDHLWGYSLDARYRWTELLDTRFGYTFERRDSTIPIFTFNRNVLSLAFEFGRRNEKQGRPF